MAVIGSLVAGQVLTASELNAIGAWTAFTPTWNNITVGTGGNASNTGQYSLLNKILYFRVKMVFGTTGMNMSASMSLTVPASATLATSPTMTWIPSLSAVATDSGVASYPMSVLQLTTTTLAFYLQTASGTYLTSATQPSSLVPFTWAGNDYVEVAGWVQVV